MASSKRRSTTIRQSPKDHGVLELIVRRPRVGARDVLEEGELDPVGRSRRRHLVDARQPRSADGGPHPEMQLNIMNAARGRARRAGQNAWPLAGDQLSSTWI